MSVEYLPEPTGSHDGKVIVLMLFFSMTYNIFNC